MERERLLDKMVSRLYEVLDTHLVSVVLYGAEAHGDTYRTVSQANLMVVCTDLEPHTLGLLTDPVRWWLRKGQPWPRLFTAALIRDSLDVYPMEFLDIARHRRVLHGEDPLADVTIDASQLRLQCERELREKLMRLREGYIETHGRPRHLRDLLATSYASFALVWRGYLHLLGADVPTHDAEVAEQLCARLDLSPTPFEEVAMVAAAVSKPDADTLFASYYGALERMVASLDRLAIPAREEST